MKATGIVRRIDKLGRVVLPIELRRTLEIDINAPVEIFCDGEDIIIRKFHTRCVLCGETESLMLAKYKDKTICRNCIKNLKLVNI